MKYIITTLYLIFCFQSAIHAQNIEHLEKEVEYFATAGGFSSGPPISFTLDFQETPMTLDRKIEDGFLKVSLDLGDEFFFGGENFELSVTFNLTALDEGSAVAPLVFQSSPYTLAINEGQPEAYVIVDFDGFKETVDGNERVRFDEVVLEVISTSSTNSLLDSYAAMRIGYEVDLGYDVNQLQSSITGINVSSPDKTVTFSWNDDIHVSHYQLQLLRLHNVSPSKVEENNIIANIDWRKALTIDIDLIDPMQKEYTHRLAGGTGFYAARIRPVGGYLPGGSGNAGNWGEWSSYLMGLRRELTEAGTNLQYFYFEDNEDNTNWIYSRVYTEDTRVKENISYADGLLKVKQEQTYLPSKNITLIQQTVYDQIGRPAITSIPVPVPNKQSTYRKEFMKAAGTDEIFQAKHFDTDAKLRNPDLVDEGTDFAYYKDNVDKSIPNAEGFGYTRTIYYNDGSNRVREQSGVGKTHSVDATEGGRTTKYLYATPAEEELIAIFGDEAPAGESVLKTVTIDPNNTTSVTYTSKEGNVIATSLVFSDADNNLIPLDNLPGSTSYNDKITVNLKKEGGFVSSKRLALAVPTDVNVGYSIRCPQLSSLCVETEIDCNFRLDLILHTLSEQGEIVSSQAIYEDFDLNSVSCQLIDGDDYKVVPPVILSAVPPGSYLVEKTLKPTNVEAAQSQNRETIENGVYPITDLIANWLESITTASEIGGFNQAIFELANVVNSGTLVGFSRSGKFNVDFADAEFAQFSALYSDALTNANIPDYALIIEPLGYDPSTNGNPTKMFLETPCCPSIDVPIRWVPELDCEEIESNLKLPEDASLDGYFNVVNYYDIVDAQSPISQEFFPDFEGYMLAFFADCIDQAGEPAGTRDFTSEQALKDLIYRGVKADNPGTKIAGYFDGWETEGTFNLMIYNMLTDSYDIDSKLNEDLSDDEAPYTCDELINCWLGVLSRLKEEICQATFDFYDSGGNTNVSNTFDDRNDGDRGVHDNHFDQNFKGKGFFLTRWIAKRKISKKMRKLQIGGGGDGEIDPVLGQFHVVDEFLQCAGYKFAKIQTPFDPQPLARDLKPGVTYVLPGTNVPVPFDLFMDQTNQYLFDAPTSQSVLPVTVINGDYRYVPLSDWDPKKRVEQGNSFVESEESLFPRIKNPIYAYKYFVYEEHARIDPVSGLPLYQPIEQSVCYTDPNDCYLTEPLTGNILLDGSGMPIVVDCCSEDPNTNPTGCYQDSDYPNDPNRWVVDNFLGTGRITCAETHEDWTAAQRLTFYEMLATYDPQSTYDDQTVIGLDLTCDDFANANSQWYFYKKTTGEDQEVFDLPDLINQDIYDALHTQHGAAKMSEWYDGLILTKQDGSTKTSFAYYELEIENRIAECQVGCENLRGRFLEKLYDLLEAKCYVIEGCRTDDPATHNVIPEEDIEVILEQLVQSCQAQCNMTTYSCEETWSRPLDLPITVRSTITNSQLDLETNFGVGGYPSTAIIIIDDPENQTIYDYADDIECSSSYQGRQLVPGFQFCDLKENIDKSINSLSWYEYTLLRQVESWDFELDIQSFCEGETDPWPYEGETAGTNDTRGSTFVPRERYEVDGAAALNGFSAGDQTKSPVKMINVEVQNEDQ